MIHSKGTPAGPPMGRGLLPVLVHILYYRCVEYVFSTSR